MTVWLTTKKGDGGQTELYDRTLLAKDDPLVELYGTVDEAQAALGMARALSDGAVAERAKALESRLFELMAHLAHADTPVPPVAELEEWQNEARQAVGERFSFRLPGDSKAEAAWHLARTIIRRAERRAVSLAREGRVSSQALRYLNRLSDCFYALMLHQLHQ